MDTAMTGVLGELHSKACFDRPEEAEALEQRIDALIASGQVEEMPVAQPEHPLLEEHWYRDVVTGDVYRYCPPEYPARGTWQKIEVGDIDPE